MASSRFRWSSRCRPALLGVLVPMVGACISGKGSAEGLTDDDGDGSAVVADARFLTDVYTWTCQESDGSDLYQGIFGQSYSLEYAPGAVTSLELPSPGTCIDDLNMRPLTAGDGGLDVPDMGDRPRWEALDNQGVMDRLGRGFYRDDVFPGERTCLAIDEVLGGGARLTEAGVLTGVQAPAPVEVPTVSFEGLSGDGIVFGDEITVSWAESDWDEVWISLAREREGVAFESATCNASDRTSFTIGAESWALMTEELEVQQNVLYIGFQRSEWSTTEDGLEVLSTTRAIAIATVSE